MPPRRGLHTVEQIFLAPPYYSQHAVFTSLWALFSLLKLCSPTLTVKTVTSVLKKSQKALLRSSVLSRRRNAATESCSSHNMSSRDELLLLNILFSKMHACPSFHCDLMLSSGRPLERAKIRAVRSPSMIGRRGQDPTKPRWPYTVGRLKCQDCERTLQLQLNLSVAVWNTMFTDSKAYFGF